MFRGLEISCRQLQVNPDEKIRKQWKETLTEY